MISNEFGRKVTRKKNDPSKYMATTEIVSRYDHKIPQSQTADKPMVPRGRATQQSRDTRKTSYEKQPALSSPSR